MAGESGARRREPLLLGTIGAVIGIVLALVVFGGFGGGSASASASPTSGAAASPSPTLTAGESTTPSAEASVPPITAAPTIVATFAPTAAPTAKPSPTPNTNPRIISFDTPAQEDCTNSTAGSVHVSWSVTNATGVSISIAGPGVYKNYSGLSGEDDLPFPCSESQLQQSYTLTTVGGSGPAASVTKTIKTRAASIQAFALSKVTECSGSSGSATLRLSYTVRAATGADLSWRSLPDGSYSVYGQYNGKEVGPIPISYDCTYDSIRYKLVTTGGYGEPDEAFITITRP